MCLWGGGARRGGGGGGGGGRDGRSDGAATVSCYCRTDVRHPHPLPLLLYRGGCKITWSGVDRDGVDSKNPLMLFLSVFCSPQ